MRWVLLAVMPLFCTTVAAAEPTPVAPADLCFTDGTVTRLPDDTLRIDSPAARAVANATDGRSAELRFRYLGPSSADKKLASGELRRQIGVKLRGADSCNVVYAMWHIEPDSKISVLVKRNPGQHSNTVCHNNGYETVAPVSSIPMPRIAPGENHVLRAVQQGNDLLVTADNVPTWRGKLPDTVTGFDGPTGLRTDNASVEFRLLAGAAPPWPGFRCAHSAGD